MFKILITGSKGQLGRSLHRLMPCYGYDCYYTTSKSLDITNTSKIRDYIQSNDINIIINCAAYTAVDKAENDRKKANLINHVSVKNLAQIAKENNINLIHISTDYVFDGKYYLPYTEIDITNPSNVYGQTKLEGENAMRIINPKNSIIIRTSWTYSMYGNNFVNKILRLGKEKSNLEVVFDQVGTPTYTIDLAKTILDILPKIKNSIVEIYHYSNEGISSWYDLAKEIILVTKLKCKIEPIETKTYLIPVIRPPYSVLSKNKIKNTFDITIPYWRESLEKMLTENIK